MKKSGTIRGTVTYRNEQGQRLSIPLGPCQIEEYALPSKVAARIWWIDARGEHTTDLNEEEWAHYMSNRALTIAGA